MAFGFRFIVLAFCVFMTTVQCQTLAKKTEPTKDEVAKQVDAKKQRPKDDSLVPRGFDFANAPEIIAFGAGLNQDKPQPIWDVIFKSNPDLFIFAGDTINAVSAETRPISAQYRKLNLIPEFRHFRERVPMMATWDETDYGSKNGGADFADKDESRREFLYQWSYVKDSLKMDQKGIYHAKILGGVRKKSPTFQVILLDTRWFRSPLKKVDDSTAGTTKIVANEDKKATLLGDAQWEWLERQLRKPADVRIVVSSIQLIADDTGFERWANFPREKERFYDLLKKTQARNLFVVSGNRSKGTIARQEIKGWGTLYDFTASGLNTATANDDTDKAYVGDQVKTENFGLVSVDWAHKKMDVQLRDISNNIKNKVEIKIR